MPAKASGSCSITKTPFRKTQPTTPAKLYLGTTAKLGTAYTTDYLKVCLYTKDGVGSVDWDKTYNFLTDDCGRKLDCYLYLNGDNPAGTWWHEYKFK